MADPQTFAGSGLDRASHRRGDRAWVKARIEDPSSRFLGLWRLQILTRPRPGAEGGRALAWARRELLDAADADLGALLLGLDGGVAHFAVDVSALEEPLEALGVAGAAELEEARGLAARLEPAEAAIVAQARSLVDWHARHRFCSACGAATRPAQAGWVRVCPECSAEHFPRTDPVVIALVTHGARCLLGRQASWPARFFSALAGFMEPGETIEEAVRREVAEEAAVAVAAVRYHASQPWPFPSSLMIGCLAEAAGDAITVDGVELEDARWFERDTVRAALAGRAEELLVPPPLAIAHHLMRAFVEEG